MEPILVTDEFTIRHLRAFREEEIVQLIVKLCDRASPLLSLKPLADLQQLGRNFYRKGLSCPCSLVMSHTPSAELIALDIGWDAADGGLWSDDVRPPASLRAHAFVGQAALVGRAKDTQCRRGEVIHCAFGGVVVPHPAIAFVVLKMANLREAIRSGFHRHFETYVHPSVIKLTQGSSAYLENPENYKRVNFDDIIGAVSDVVVKEELAQTPPGYLLTNVSDIRRSLTHYESWQEQGRLTSHSRL